MFGLQRRLGLAALALVLGSAALAADENADGGVKVRLPVVTVTAADRTEVVARIPVSGTLVPREEVLVYPQINGYAIEKINVDVGDRVEAGDVLAVLNDRTLNAQLTQAEAELQRAQAGVGQAQNQIDSTRAAKDEADAALERNETLGRSGNVSQANLIKAQSAAASARAAFASAQDGLEVAKAQVVQATAQRELAALNLSRSQIAAPVSGIISARSAKLGAISASGGDPMFRIIRDGEVEMEAEVIETAFGSIEVGDPTEVVTAANSTVDGKVRLVAPTVDQVTRLGVIRISLESAAPLRTGTFASGWITTDRHMATTVPASAVLTDLEGSYVQIVKDGVVEKRQVVAGLLSEDGRREIIRGIEEGETVMARAGLFFRSGDRVDPVTAAKSAESASQ